MARLLRSGREGGVGVAQAMQWSTHVAVGAAIALAVAATVLGSGGAAIAQTASSDQPAPATMAGVAVPTAMELASEIYIENFDQEWTSPPGVWSDYATPSKCNGTWDRANPFGSYLAAIPITPSEHRLSGALDAFGIDEGEILFDGHRVGVGCAAIEVYDSPHADSPRSKRSPFPPTG